MSFPSKYRNKKVVVDGVKFDSLKESKEYFALKIRQDAGEISNLRMQVRYPIVVNNTKVCSYIADFVYEENGLTIIKDVKSYISRINPVYRIKVKLMLACYGVSITEA